MKRFESERTELCFTRGLFPRWLLETVLVFGLILVLGSVRAGVVVPRRVLIVYSYGRGFGPFSIVASEFQTELARESRDPVQFHEATLEAPNLDAGESEGALIAYLGALSRANPPELIVPFGAPAVRFVLRNREKLFGAKPILLASVEERFLTGLTLGTNTTAVTVRFDFPGVLASVLRVWPGTTNIAVVLGNSTLERFWKQEMLREFLPFTNRVRFDWLNELPLEEVEKRLRQLPGQSVVFYGVLIIDAAGVPYEQEGALMSLYPAANAPIVGMFEESLGSGVVGGPLLSLRKLGRETAHIARRILNGESPAQIQIPAMGPSAPVYDGRELKRWKVREERLPAGSEVRFRTPSLLAAYRWRVLFVIGLCLLESVLILALVHQLRRRHAMERSLRESEERMKLAASAAHLEMWEWNLVSDQVWATGQTATRLGKLEGGQGDFADFLQAVHMEDRDAVVRAVAKAVRGDGAFECVHRAILDEGKARWMNTRGRVEFDAAHKPLRMRGIWMDITVQKEAENNAQESEDRFLLMANSAPVLIWASGSDKLCTFFNRPWLEFTGRALEEELGNGWTQDVHPDDLAACLKAYTAAFDARSPFTIEYRLRRHDGEYRWIIDHGVPRYDPHANFAGYIGSCMDVTDRRNAEADAHLARQELVHMNRASTLGELAGSLAHELNQPLSAILSNAQAAQRFLTSHPADLGEVREILQDIVNQDRRAGEVISRMRSMLQKREPQRVAVDLNEVVAEVLRLMHSEFVVRNVVVESYLAPDRPFVKGDRIELQQVLVNLIVNACEAMNANHASAFRKLTIRVDPADPGAVQVSLTDNGPGFAREMLEQAFEPFCTTKNLGLGLGLAICRSIVSAHGGRIWVDRASQPGATIRFTVPVAENENV
jgi:two-component system sensor kinase FixL